MSPSPHQSRPADQPEPDIARAAAIAVSMGDPAGIGPDIALISWLQRQHHALPPFVLYADPDVLAQRARALGLAVPLAAVASPAEATAAFAVALPVWPRLRGDDQQSHQREGVPLLRWKDCRHRVQ